MDKKIIKWIKDFKVFTALTIVMVALIGVTAWMNRPNSMRTPRYVVEKDYTNVVGSHNFDADLESLMFTMGTKIVKTHFRLDQSYCLESNNIDICINGYELFEVKDKQKMHGGSREIKTKNFLIVNLSLINNRSEDIRVERFGYGTNNQYDTIRPVSDDETKIKLDKNLAQYIGYSDNELILKPNETKEGNFLYPLSTSAFNQLYFEGNFVLEVPDISEVGRMEQQYLFENYTYIELPVVPVSLEKYLESLESLPNRFLKSGYGYTKVTNVVYPNIEMENDDGTIKVVLEQIEDGIATYKPSYFDTRTRYSQNNSSKYTTMKVTFTNNTKQAIDSNYLEASLGPKNENLIRGATPISRNRIQPNETVTLIFDFESYADEYLNYPLGEPLRFSINAANNMNLIDAILTIEE